jgi:catechol 2,3-dioxygenase-like lactoylglutathione lyase family enzyme
MRKCSERIILLQYFLNPIILGMICLLSASKDSSCEDSTEYQPGIATLGTSKGLLELYHIPADSSTPYESGNDYSRPGVGFGHIGFTVPDVAETLERVKSFGFEVIKPLDEAKITQFGMPDDVVQGMHGEVPEGYKHVFKQLAFAKDPDVSRKTKMIRPSAAC